MKLLKIISGYKRKSRINEDFEKLCQMMFDAPSFDYGVSVDLDNEFYARFGMSAAEVAELLSAMRSGA